MGLFGNDDKQEEQTAAGVPDNGQAPTQDGTADDVQGAMPPAQPPVDTPPVGDDEPLLPTGDSPEEGSDEDNQVPPVQ